MQIDHKDDASDDSNLIPGVIYALGETQCLGIGYYKNTQICNCQSRCGDGILAIS